MTIPIRYAYLMAVIFLLRLSPVDARPVPGENWAGIYMDGRKAGYAFYAVDVDSGGAAYRLRTRFRLEVLMMGVNRVMSQVSEARLDRDFRLLDFKLDFTSDDSGFHGWGRMGSGGRLEMSVITRSDTSRRVLQVPRDVFIDGSVEPFIGLNFSEFGTRTVLNTFEPVTGLMDSVVVTKLDPEKLATPSGETLAFPFRLVDSTGEAKLWLSQSGGLLKEIGPLGMELRAEPRDVAAGQVRDDDRVDFLTAFAVKANRFIPDPRNLKRLRVRLDGLEDVDWIPIDSRQNWIDRDRWILEILAADVEVDPVPEDADRYLEPGPFVQSDDPRIVSQAELIAAGLRQDTAKVARVVEWVHHTLFREPTVSLPSAIDVLKERKGDCNEHTILTVALLRSLGVPSRQAVGLVYESGSFYYHAWPEVYIDGWRGIEPTLGGLWTDATHIKLAQGGLDRQQNILKAMNRLEIEIVYFE
ncbi:transglutaminase family protein [candidate division KSB1 bacterium]